MKKFNEFIASVLLAACVICLLVSLYKYTSFSHVEPQLHTYTYVIKTDSTGKLTPEAKAQIDTVVNTIKQHEQTIKDRYDYVLEQRQYEEEYITIGGIIITIILSIFGFFGYKSFKSIEEDAVSEAKKAAEQNTDRLASVKAEKIAREITDKLSNELRRDQKKSLNDFKKKDIPDAARDAVKQEFNLKVESHITAIDNNTSRIEELESQTASLQKQIDEMLQTRPVKKPERQSITSASGLTSTQLIETIDSSIAKIEEHKED